MHHRRGGERQTAVNRTDHTYTLIGEHAVGNGMRDSRKLAARTGTDSVHFPGIPFPNRYRKLRSFRVADDPLGIRIRFRTGLRHGRVA
jgi:hypothetical protein